MDSKALLSSTDGKALLSSSKATRGAPLHGKPSAPRRRGSRASAATNAQVG